MTTAGTDSRPEPTTATSVAEVDPAAMERPGPLRLLAVELRKLTDTASGVALFVLAAVLAGVFGGGTALFAQEPDLTRVAVMAAMPAAVITAVLAALTVCAETTRRTGLSTYALTPQRWRILAAKLGAITLLTLAITPLSLLAALICGPIGGALNGRGLLWELDLGELALLTLSNLLTAWIGAEVALALQNTAAAIVIILAWPTVVTMASISPALSEVLSWIDMAPVHTLRDGANGIEVIKIITGSIVWIAVPGLIGTRRLLRAEVR